MRTTVITAIFLSIVPHGQAARLSQSAADEFSRYATGVELRLARQHGSADTCLATAPDAMRVTPVDGGAHTLNGALLHHWRAAAFVPHASLQATLNLLRDFNHFSKLYSPQVVESHARTDGVALRLKEKRVVTVVLDAEFQVETRIAADGCGYSLSRSTHIWQVDDPGTTREHRRAANDGDGFLWRLNSYWSFVETRDRSGVWIECEAVSLTRDVPLGLGWLLAPVIEQFPRETLEFTLKATRNALTAKGVRDDSGSL